MTYEMLLTKSDGSTVVIYPEEDVSTYQDSGKSILVTTYIDDSYNHHFKNGIKLSLYVYYNGKRYKQFVDKKIIKFSNYEIRVKL